MARTCYVVDMMMISTIHFVQQQSASIHVALLEHIFLIPSQLISLSSFPSLVITPKMQFTRIWVK